MLGIGDDGCVFWLAGRAEEGGKANQGSGRREGQKTCRVVLVTGFESFNVQLYQQVCTTWHMILASCPMCPQLYTCSM